MPATATRARFHELTVAAVDRLTDDAAAVTFAVPERLRAAYAFDAGQTLTLRRHLDGQEHRRSYSICAPVGRALRVGVREIPGGLFSSWLVHDVRPGDVVEVQTPTGRLRADPTSGGRHLCIAAGSGITPMLSIAATVLTHPAARVTLIYNNRTTGSVMFAEELADLKDRHGPRLDLVHVLSREPRDVDLFSGRLDADRLRRLLTALVPVDSLDHVWLCGPLGLVDGARGVLTEFGVAAERVHVELFHVDEPPPEVRRVDATVAGDATQPGSTDMRRAERHSSGAPGKARVRRHPGGLSSARNAAGVPEGWRAAVADSWIWAQVTVRVDGRTTTSPMPRDRSILDGAAATRSDLPFACKGGVCGTCRARVTEGAVDMRRNYALDDDEVARGFVLTCQSFPGAEAVTVDFDG